MQARTLTRPTLRWALLPVVALLAISSYGCANNKDGKANDTSGVVVVTSRVQSSTGDNATGSTPAGKPLITPNTVMPDLQTVTDITSANASRELTSQGPENVIHVHISGDCISGYRLTSTGFGDGTTGHQYQTQAWYVRTGTEPLPYTYMKNGGLSVAEKDGSTPDWVWSCLSGAGGLPDPAGQYVIRITDLVTGQAVAFKFFFGEEVGD